MLKQTSAHKRAFSGFNQPSYPPQSGSKINPSSSVANPLQSNQSKKLANDPIKQSTLRIPINPSGSKSRQGTGSIMYNNQMKIEGDLSMTKNNNRDNSSLQFSNSKIFKANTDPAQKLLDGRSVTPTRGLNNQVFGGFKSNPGITSSGTKIKKVDPKVGIVKELTKKPKSYYGPQSARDQLNNSNISNNNVNKSRINESNNSFLNNDINKNKFSKIPYKVGINSRNGSPNTSSRSQTPNLNTKFKSKSNIDLNKTYDKTKYGISKSPASGLRITKNTSTNKINNDSGPGSKITSKNPFDMLILKQVQETKITKSNPLSSYVNKNKNILNSTKFGSQTKKKITITGNLVIKPESDISNVFSTDSTRGSKIDQLQLNNTNIHSNNTTNHLSNPHSSNNSSNNVNVITPTNEKGPKKSEIFNQIPIKLQDKDNNQLANKDNIPVQQNKQNINLEKEKVKIDLKAINTSPFTV